MLSRGWGERGVVIGMHVVLGMLCEAPTQYPLFNIFRKMVYCDPMQCPKKLLEYGFGPLECNQTTIGCGACNAKDI